MNFLELKTILSQNPTLGIEFRFESNATLAPHFHITEIGIVTKDFVDCGGTRRTTQSCMLQTLVANDTDHRLTSDKFASIVTAADVLGMTDSLPVEAEIQAETIGIYAVDSVDVRENVLTFLLRAKRTACLAPSACRLDPLPIAADSDCCGESGCC